MPEVLQELLHAYLPLDRLKTFDAAFKLVRSRSIVWDVEAEDIEVARALTDDYPELEARDAASGMLQTAGRKRREYV